MPLDVTAETEIARSADEVAAYAFDPANDTAWTSGIKAAEIITEPPVRQGSRVRRVATFLGRRIDYVMEVVALEPGRRMAMHAIESPFPMDVTYEFQPLGPDRTRARIRVQGAGRYRFAARLLAAVVRRSITKDVRALKRITESRSPTSSVRVAQLSPRANGCSAVRRPPARGSVRNVYLSPDDGCGTHPATHSRRSRGRSR